MNQAQARGVGMTRRNDYDTSERAAAKVSKRKPTIRQRVSEYALNRSAGFIDEELAQLDPTGPESSYRKRRSELSDDAVILPVPGETRRNSKGQDCQVWLHRIYFVNPPPEKKRQPKPSKATSLQEENARLRVALGTAIKVADEARVEWDEAPSGMKAGKLLIALSGHLPRYRADIDAIHAALRT